MYPHSYRFTIACTRNTAQIRGFQTAVSRMYLFSSTIESRALASHIHQEHCCTHCLKKYVSILKRAWWSTSLVLNVREKRKTEATTLINGIHIIFHNIRSFVLGASYGSCCFLPIELKKDNEEATKTVCFIHFFVCCRSWRMREPLRLRETVRSLGRAYYSAKRTALYVRNLKTQWEKIKFRHWSKARASSLFLHLPWQKTGSSSFA